MKTHYRTAFPPQKMLAIYNAVNLMRISLNIFFFKACPFSEWPQKYLGKCRNILPVAGAASLILPDMTY